MQDLIEAAQRWMESDPDPVTRAEAAALLASGDEAVLREQFGARLQFGTAGIRGAMGAGPGRINRALIGQVTAGLGRYLLRVVGDAATRGVVIGFDGRHNSRQFADDAAGILAGMGIAVLRFDEVVPTPVLAHAVTACGAAAGVMVTASHNPPADNGYKVYWGNGAQIIPPHDKGISAEIDDVGGPWGVSLPPLDEVAERIRPVPAATWVDYLQRVLSWRVLPETGAVAVYTAMHGVGWESMRRVAAAAGHQPLLAVAEQRDPDGDFPTVSFPNPEEPGALDLAYARAAAEGADLIIAHDPDADRLAVALPDAAGEGWSRLTGDEVGLLLADTMLRHGPQDGPRMVANTIVSTSLLGRLAEAHGAELAETLTGFKWIANAALDFEGTFLVGFEEALGYSVGDVVRDKDGVSAALHILDLASWCKARGKTLREHLEGLYRTYGYVASAQSSIRMPGAAGQAAITAILAKLRAAPPTTLAGIPVRCVRDVLAGTATTTATGAVVRLDLPRSNVLAFDMAQGCRVLARPSGTEPKIKFYFEVIIDLEEQDVLSDVAARARARIAALKADLLAQVGL
ncbi:MAG: phosphomannomutase [Myxococcota bacterium]|jgi:phosphomannomutase